MCFLQKKNCENGNIWTIFCECHQNWQFFAFSFYPCLIFGVVMLFGVSVGAGSLLLLVGWWLGGFNFIPFWNFIRIRWRLIDMTTNWVSTYTIFLKIYTFWCICKWQKFHAGFRFVEMVLKDAPMKVIYKKTQKSCKAEQRKICIKIWLLVLLEKVL